MKNEVLYSFTYGMYAVGVTDGKQPSACIVNTVTQAAGQPNMLTVSINRKNYSYACIHRTGLFTVSVLSEDTSGAVIGALGFQSGRAGNKLENIRYKMLQEGVPVIKENSCCWFLCKVVDKMETPTHTVFLAEILAGSDRMVGKPMTYAYYHQVIKGSAPKNAPTYQKPTPDLAGNDGESFICRICRYVYEDQIVPFEELPDDWVCPVCGAPKSAFQRQLRAK
ncbi:MULTISPECIES: flavin reductase [Caproicibacterium]|uniref:Flavin reductase n=1 Tax=Caproicibacterium argilliputei TaxID=3030016 RepID=A0AA97H041_9FIRM|nr:flavin reductase [Caproicibacterium argilliputei]WOC31171.1 flavin reductase [Caproicibacterium argilliputei]